MAKMTTETIENLTKIKPTPTLSWQKPIPLVLEMNEGLPYPVECLPTIIQDAVVNYQQYGQQPFPMVACSALANVSLACQSLANVARDHLLISPVSLYFLVIAGSGERKTAADHAFSQSIRRWEIKIRKELAPEVKDAKLLNQAFMAQKKGLLSQIKKASLTGESDLLELNQRFIELCANEPDFPLLPMLFFEDATQEALVSHLAEGWPSASLWSDEGGIVLAGHGMQSNTTKFVALLNRLWDGKSFAVHRKTSKNFIVSNRRLTVSLMLQPLIMQQMLSKGGGISRQSGFLARCLIAFPDSSMGDRFYQEPPKTLTALPRFHQRLTECLDESLFLDHQGCYKIPQLSFSSQAKTRWVNFFNAVESGLKQSNQWSSIQDFASKAAENAARLSALFHLFEGKEGKISSESVEQATQIIHWHLCETRRILDSEPRTSSQHEDAMKLLRWMQEKVLLSTTFRYLQQYSPLREKSKLSKAIQTLIENHHLQETRLDGKSLLWANPHSARQP